MSNTENILSSLYLKNIYFQEKCRGKFKVSNISHKRKRQRMMLERRNLEVLILTEDCSMQFPVNVAF